jgi:adenine-specific DNA-methyltransferase
MQAEYGEEDETGKYRALELRNRNAAFNPKTRPNLYFPIFVDPKSGGVSLAADSRHTVKALPNDSNDNPTCWTWNPKKVEKDKALLIGRQTKDGVWRVFRKDYLISADGETATTKPKTVWLDRELNMDLARKTLRQIMGKEAFDFPKPVRLVEKLIELLPGDNALVLDSFAGSGTTGHAVLEANQNDGGSRRFILVESEDYASTLTAERVRRVIRGYKFEGTQKEELLREPVTLTTLKNPDKLLKQVEAIENLESHRFDRIKREIESGVLVVNGEKQVTGKTEGLGGEFTFCTLGEPLDLDKILTGKALPDYESVGAWLFHTATGESLNTSKVRKSAWFLGESSAYYVWLIYKPDLEFLKSNKAALTLELA